jgi:hypothetical protein
VIPLPSDNPEPVGADSRVVVAPARVEPGSRAEPYTSVSMTTGPRRGWAFTRRALRGGRVGLLGGEILDHHVVVRRQRAGAAQQLRNGQLQALALARIDRVARHLVGHVPGGSPPGVT